jgi:hypothetical protein
MMMPAVAMIKRITPYAKSQYDHSGLKKEIMNNIYTK